MQETLPVGANGFFLLITRSQMIARQYALAQDKLAGSFAQPVYFLPAWVNFPELPPVTISDS